MSGQYDPAPGLDINESRQPQVWVSLLIPYTVAFLTVIGRFTSRRIAKSGSWFDDWLMALAMMVATGTLAGTGTAVQAGLGRHIWYFPFSDIWYHAQDILLGLFILDNLYYGCYALAKLSVLALYWRTFRNKSIRRVVYVLILAVILLMGVSITLTVLECSPVNGFWMDPLGATCPIPRIPLHVGLSIASASVNLIILVIPIPLFLDPQHTNLHRFVLALVFGFGLFVLAVSVIRTLAVANTDITKVDLFWNLTNAWAWTAIELYCAIIAANVPTLGHLVARFVPSLDSRSLSPAHTGSVDALGQSAVEKPSSRADRARGTERQLSPVTEEVYPMAADYDSYAAKEKDLPPAPEAWFDASEEPLPEREPVRQVDHGIAEWEFAPSTHSRPDPAHMQHAHPGQRVLGRWDGSSGEEVAFGGTIERPQPEPEPHQRSVNFTDAYTSPTLTYDSSRGRHTSSYASDHGLLSPRSEHPANQRRSIAAPSWVSSARSSGLVPPINGRQHAYSLSADATSVNRDSSSSTSSNGSPTYGQRQRASWYRRGTATTPEPDWAFDQLARESSQYSGRSFVQRVRGGQGYSVVADDGRYGPAGSLVAPTSIPSPSLGPPPAPPIRNPRRETTGYSTASRHSDSDSPPDTALATSLTVTRVGPEMHTSPQLQQGPFADGWRTSSPPAIDAQGRSVEPSPVPPAALFNATNRDNNDAPPRLHNLQTTGLAHSGGHWVALSPPTASPADATMQLAAALATAPSSSGGMTANVSPNGTNSAPPSSRDHSPSSSAAAAMTRPRAVQIQPSLTSRSTSRGPVPALEPPAQRVSEESEDGSVRVEIRRGDSR